MQPYHRRRLLRKYSRMLKKAHTVAVVQKDSYPVLPIFNLLAKKGNIEEQMMYNTFNMGIGMVLAVDPEDVDKTMEAIRHSRRYSICDRPH